MAISEYMPIIMSIVDTAINLSRKLLENNGLTRAQARDALTEYILDSLAADGKTKAEQEAREKRLRRRLSNI